jgi:hypothetical protein
VNFARALAGLVGDDRRLAEGELQGLEPVAERARVIGADLGRAGGDEAGQGGDELARLVQVLVVGALLGEAEVDRGRAHEVDGDGGDHLDRGDVRDVARDGVEVRTLLLAHA